MNDISFKNQFEILKKENFNFKKELGQNFLIDNNILSNIVNFSNIDKTSSVLEIGAGNGFLSMHIAPNCKKLVVVEIDKTILPILQKNLSSFNNVYIINDNFLNISNLDSYFDTDNVFVIANLPYYITSPIIMKLLSYNFIKNITITVQKEIAKRICSLPNNKDYGVLSIAVQYYSNVTLGFTISKNCFFPKPKVDSAVINIYKNNNLPKANDTNKFFHIVKASFANRRKTLINSLSNNSSYDKQTIFSILSKLNLKENIRAENLSINDFIFLSNNLP